jgi:hypothetical protein
MNKFRTFIKFVFFAGLFGLLNVGLPTGWAFVSTWVFAGLIGIERIFPGTVKFDKDSDWVGLLLFILGACFGGFTFLLAECLGDVDPSKVIVQPQEPYKKNPEDDKVHA